jgi:hypothetical protein
MRRGQLVLILTVAAVLATATVALGFRPGIYRTKPPTSRTQFLDLSLTATRARVTHIRFDYRKLRACSNGNTLLGNESAYVIPRPRIRSKRFTLTVHNAHGGKLTVTGTFRRRKIKGTFRDAAVFNAGTIHCDTGVLRWTALRLG